MKKRGLFFGIIVLLLLTAISINVVAQVSRKQQYNYNTKNRNAAKQAGYKDSYSYCNRMGTIRIDGQDYYYFRSEHRNGFTYTKEDLLVPCSDSFIDNVATQTGGLILYANETGSISDETAGVFYRCLDLYSICNDAVGNNKDYRLQAMIIGILIAAICVVMLLIYLLAFVVKRLRND